MIQLQELRDDVKKMADPQKAMFMQRFFKTGVGQYGYGDVFAGLTVPQSRLIALKYKTINTKDIKILLKSKIPEEKRQTYLKALI